MIELKPQVRLLYVDDDVALARLVQKELGRQGYEVVCAADGDQGLSRLAEGGFDVCALDHYMPGRDGIDVLPEIIALPDAPPVVYVTGAQEGALAVAALRAGAADYVIKDVSSDFVALLRNAVDDALARRRLQREHEAAQAEIAAARDRAEAMLREVNHRVGNSLQLVSSFISLQARQLSDGSARMALREAQSRIEAVAHVHRRLYASGDMSTVALDEYLHGLVEEMGKSLGAEGAAAPDLKLLAEPLTVSTDQAVSLGVIVSELITNAAKYAYAPGQGGEIRIRLERADDHRALLTVEDDGPGMDPAEAKPKGTGLGRKIIAAMAGGLKSALEFDPSHKGVRARLAFDL